MQKATEEDSVIYLNRNLCRSKSLPDSPFFSPKSLFRVVKPPFPNIIGFHVVGRRDRDEGRGLIEGGHGLGAASRD